MGTAEVAAAATVAELALWVFFCSSLCCFPPSSHDVLGDLRDRPSSHDPCVASDYFCAFISALFSLLSACTFCLLSFRSPSCIDFALPRSTFRAAISMNSYAFLYYSRCRQTKTWQDLSIRMGRPWRCQRKGPRRAAATMMVLLISPRSKQGRSAAPQGNEPKSLSRHLVSKC